MAVEESLRAEIRELRSALGTLSTTVNSLNLALSKDTELAKLHIISLEKAANQRIDSLEKLVTEMIERLGEPQNNFPQEAINRLFYALVIIAVILVGIAILIGNGGNVSAMINGAKAAAIILIPNLIPVMGMALRWTW